MELRFVKAKLELKISSDDIVKIINKLKNAGIVIYEIRYIDESAECTIDFKDLDVVKDIVETNKASLEIQKEKGIYYKIKRMKNLYSYLVGIVLFAIILHIVSLYLWNIEYSGNLTITDQQLKQYLEDNNITTGVFKSTINCNKIEADIRNKFNDITWVCAEIRGTNLIIHVKENYNKEISVEENAPYNLVSKHNSIIKSIITRQGIPTVKVGDIVKEGDMLISGTVEVYNEYEELLFVDYVNADGDVYGETTFYYEDTFSMSYIDKSIFEESKKIPYIQLFGNTIGGVVNGKDNYFIIDENKTMQLFQNFFIPIKIGVKKQYFYENVDKTYTKEEAIDVANRKISIFLQGLEEKEMQILEKDVKIDVGKNLCKMHGYITVVEQLTKVSPIEYQEEGTTVIDERNRKNN